MNKFSAEYNAVLEICADALFNNGTRSFDFEASNLDVVCEECVTQGIAGLLSGEIEKLNISESEYSRCEAAIAEVEHMHLRISMAVSTLDKLFNNNGIDYAIIKGLAASQYYPQPELRAMGDVDIIVCPKDFDRADKLLRDHGYKVKGEPQYRHIEYGYQGVVLELHRQFSKSDNSQEISKIDELIYAGVSNSLYTSLNYTEFRALPDLENGLVLLYHIKNHFARGLGLRHIIDWVVYVNKVLDDKFWHETFEPVVEKIGLKDLAMITARTGQLYLGLTENNCSWCKSIDDDLCSILIEYIFSSGDFGRKTSASLAESLSEIKEHGGLIKSLQLKGLNSGWSMMEKHPSLRSVAWIYQGFSFVRRNIKKGLIKTIFKANNQYSNSKELMKKMGIK